MCTLDINHQAIPVDVITACQGGFGAWAFLSALSTYLYLLV